MTLVDHQIREAVTQGELGIANFDAALVQPASYDLRVGAFVYAPPTPDQPIDLSRNGSAFRLPPYASAVFMTYESLRLPINMAGRFGLTSSFARKGLIASTGPQVDPGFEGKLFVSLMNLTPVSHVIKYKDTFLSIIFERLEVQPERPYDGPYQGKYEITGEILEDLVRLEGINLTQMQSQFTQLSQHVAEWAALAGRFDEFLVRMERHTEAIEQLVASLAPGHGTRDQVPPVRDVDLEHAIPEVQRLFQERGRLYYSDVVEALHLSLDVVVRACQELERRGLIEGDRS
jgi:dCTP deaminase